MKAELRKYNSKILYLWKKFKNIPEAEKCPFLYYELNRNKVVFVGMNPSYSESKIKRLIKFSGDQELCKHIKNIKSFYKFKNFYKYNDSFKKLALIRRKDNFSNETKDPYFKKFNELSKQLDSEWESIDLFNIRHTKQKDLKGKLNSEFFKTQLEYNINLLLQLRPKTIIAVNALASSLIKESLKLTSINDKFGTYIYNINGKSIPVFLGGMITGQRALDLESLERLKWHLRYVKKCIA